MTSYKWTEVYKAALLETDWTKMQERVQAAEVAFQERKHEFTLNGGGSPEETLAIDDGLRSLITLRHEATNWLAHETGTQ
jgi:extradiol dioxygenase family protein